MIEFQRVARLATVAVASALLAACAAKAPPVAVAPPPPPPPVLIPARPLPPLGAVATMPIPALDAIGVRQTVNANLSPAQKIWNLRSALNVAALNCLDPRYQPILDAYKILLKTHAKRLTATNRALDGEYREKYGKTSSAIRDGYMTQVYNYFALPPALPDFCEAALGVSHDSLLIAPADLDTFAASALPRLEQVFENFFRAFERYRVEVAAWDVQYGPRYGATTAGYTPPLPPALLGPAPAPPIVMPAPIPAAPVQPNPAVSFGPAPVSSSSPPVSGYGPSAEGGR